MYKLSCYLNLELNDSLYNFRFLKWYQKRKVRVKMRWRSEWVWVLNF